MAGVVDEVIERIALPDIAEGLAKPFRKWREARDAGGVELKRDRPASHCLDLCGDGLSVLAAAVIGEDNVAALASDVEGGIAAEPAACACNNSDLAHLASPGVMS